MSEASLRHPPSDFISGRFVPIPGSRVVSRDPAQPDQVIWSGSPRVEHVDDAVAAARRALPEWSRRPREERIALLRHWQELTRINLDRIAGLITDEMGKVLSESRAEARGLADKVEITLDTIPLGRITDFTVRVTDTRDGRCRFRPHGVMAVIAPYNFPAHLANGHFVPALLAGNTIVLKPSDKTPGVGQLLAELMAEIGVPPGVFNVVQGGAEVAQRLVNHNDIDGILFTGSWPVGRSILEANLDRPGRMIALEMGGNNPAVVMDDADVKQAAIECARAAFATTGQRCTATRRVIVHRAIEDRFIAAFCRIASTLVIGPGRSETPVFMGPMVNDASVDAVLDFQRDLISRGGRALVEAARWDRPGAFVSPGVVVVDRFTLETDREVFGPLAQISVVDDFDEAIAQANASQYGLAASIFTASEDHFERFVREVRSGCINWNTGTAGASSKLPFGGLGRSGNHRPAAAFSVDYCAYPVANMIERAPAPGRGPAAGAKTDVPTGMQWDDRWASG